MTLAFLFIASTSSILIYTNYYYQVHIVGDFARYPEPVAAKLRRAIYYTNIDPDPKKAFEYYKQALQLANKLELDIYSEEIVGIKIEMARMFEKVGRIENATEVLEIVRREFGEWMVKEGGGKDGGWGSVVEEASQSGRSQPARLSSEAKIVKEGETGEMDWARRTNILRTLIRTHVKLGDLYSDETLNERALAEERLVWAVTAILKERKRREDEGVKEGEGELFPDDEVGAAMECKSSSPLVLNPPILTTTINSISRPLYLPIQILPFHAPLPPIPRFQPFDLPHRHPDEQPRDVNRSAIRTSR